MHVPLDNSGLEALKVGRWIRAGMTLNCN